MIISNKKRYDTVKIFYSTNVLIQIIDGVTSSLLETRLHLTNSGNMPVCELCKVWVLDSVNCLYGTGGKVSIET